MARVYHKCVSYFPISANELWGKCALLALFALLADCGQSPEPYVKVFKEHRDALREMAAIFAKIDDDQSMAAAQIKLDESLMRFESLVKAARTLPKPTDEVRTRLEDEYSFNAAASRQLLQEVDRVRRLNLKSAPAFFRHFESKTESLKLPVK